MSVEKQYREMTAEHFEPDLERSYTLDAMGSWPLSHHRFDESSKWAIKTALACHRPLLIRGEPGIGKSQIARAAAAFFNVPFLSFVVTAGSECSELLYTHDAVSRLARAQMLSHLDKQKNWQSELDDKKFIKPGKLWWAVNWQSAVDQSRIRCRQCNGNGENGREGEDCCEECGEPHHKHLMGWKHGGGAVLLIDEIDKADSDFSNGLLESLGNTGFEVEPTGQAIQPDGKPPLVVITTNEDRELPPAFLRRCLVLQLPFPEEKPEEFLVERGRIHFAKISDKVRGAAAKLVLAERERQKEKWVKPGAAEYLDILKALHELYKEDEAKQLTALMQVARFALQKNPDSSLR